jgi:FlaA1/EpsC-like NDP-sugar epimerase
MASLKQLVPVTSAADRWRSTGLIVGDACVFLLFAAIGRASHREANAEEFLLVVKTAAPFALGWFVVAPFFGVYRQSVISALRPMLLRTALAWVCALPVALVLRWLFTQEVPPLSFALVALAFNLLFLGIWRGLFALMMRRRQSAL